MRYELLIYSDILIRADKNMQYNQCIENKRAVGQLGEMGKAMLNLKVWGGVI